MIHLNEHGIFLGSEPEPVFVYQPESETLIFRFDSTFKGCISLLRTFIRKSCTCFFCPSEERGLSGNFD